MCKQTLVLDAHPAIVRLFFASCALVSLSLSVTGEREEKQGEDKEDAVQPN